jgi:hypothetical protein
MHWIRNAFQGAKCGVQASHYLLTYRLGNAVKREVGLIFGVISRFKTLIADSLDPLVSARLIFFDTSRISDPRTCIDHYQALDRNVQPPSG